MTALSGKRIGLLATSASRLGGGVFEALVLHAEMIAGQGGTPVIFAIEDRYRLEDRHRLGNAEVTLTRHLGPATVAFSPGLLPAILDAEVDLLHLHGIWQYPSHAARRWRARTGRPYVISPHGMLDPWITSRGKAKKALARIGYERASWAASDCIHALTASEAADVARESGRNDAVIIPNPAPSMPLPTVIPASSERGEADRIVYIGRIHPKKNLLPLVDAWSALDRGGACGPGAELLIAGWGDATDVAALERAVAQAPPSVRFVGPVHGEAKLDLLAGAGAVILPSLSEGLPMAMLESWALATPTIMTPHCNLPEGFEQGAAIRCGTDAEAIRQALARFFAMPADERSAMRRAALDLARGHFAQARIARMWGLLYSRLIEGRQTP